MISLALLITLRETGSFYSTIANLRFNTDDIKSLINLFIYNKIIPSSNINASYSYFCVKSDYMVNLSLTISYGIVAQW